MGCRTAGFIAYTRALTADWRLIALDSNVDGSVLQAQYEWLERFLAAGGRLRRADAGLPARDVACAVVFVGNASGLG